VNGIAATTEIGLNCKLPGFRLLRSS
jgi:hypothetical protein